MLILCELLKCIQTDSNFPINPKLSATTVYFQFFSNYDMKILSMGTQNINVYDDLVGKCETYPT